MEIESLIIPGNYTHIQFHAFENNAIKELVLEEGVLYANDFAFADNKIEELRLPDSFLYASKAAFKNNQIQHLQLPDTTISIGPEAFMNNQIFELILGSKVEHIYERAFVNNRLKEVSIPITLKNGKNGVKGIYPDFYVVEGSLEGFSSEGEKKYQKLGRGTALELPAEDKEGEKITKIASYAFQRAFCQVPLRL